MNFIIIILYFSLITLLYISFIYLNSIYFQCYFFVSRLFIQEMTKQYLIFLAVSYTLLFYSFEVSKIWCSKVETNLFHSVFHVCDKGIYLSQNFYFYFKKKYRICYDLTTIQWRGCISMFIWRKTGSGNEWKTQLRCEVFLFFIYFG